METRNVAIPCPDCGGTMLCWCSQRQHDSDLAATRAEVLRLQGEVRRLSEWGDKLAVAAADEEARAERAEGEVTALRQEIAIWKERTKGASDALIVTEGELASMRQLAQEAKTRVSREAVERVMALLGDGDPAKAAADAMLRALLDAHDAQERERAPALSEDKQQLIADAIDSLRGGARDIRDLGQRLHDRLNSGDIPWDAGTDIQGEFDGDFDNLAGEFEEAATQLVKVQEALPGALPNE